MESGCGIGGARAWVEDQLDYLTKVEGMNWLMSVGQILGQTAIKEPVVQEVPKEKEKEQGLYIPERSKTKI